MTIKKDDLCEVIGGMRGKESPNVGLVVRVIEFRGEHSQFGRIWRCEAEYAELGQPGVGCPPGQADFAQDWLRKLPPDAKPPEQVKTEREVSA
ncbi:hypothetical protein [Roseateles sp.]|uniref:hypothetical protein n=1 Tax=Roseateles sp. TaxID=1971397 RepID=UPI0031E279E9